MRPPAVRFLLVVLTVLSGQWAQVRAETVRLGQHPALSSDGKTLAFAWCGDIWTVPSKGGVARRLTQHASVDAMPAFSPDGKQIAFISDRDNGKQVYVLPSEGGEPRQLTWHTEGYDLRGWMPDGQSLLVNITRDFAWNSGGGRAARLAVLGVNERRSEEVVFDDYASEGAASPDGQRILFVREGETWWRQGYRGSRAGQIWLYHRENGTFQRIGGEDVECRWPLWKPDGKGFYYVSNRSGSFNLWEHDLETGQDRQRTSFRTDSVVFPTISRDGSTVVFRHLFDFYRWEPARNSTPEKIEIAQIGDAVHSPVERLVLDRASDVTFTSDGLQIAFISGGDVWVMDTELREPRQVTRTAEEERDVVFGPDGKSLWFISDKGGQTDLWKAAPANPGRYWWENTAFNLTRVTDDPEVESGVKFSRDGKTLGYLKGRGDLWLADSSGKNPRRIVEAWTAPKFDFSPDGQWIVYSRADEWFNNDVWLAPADGSREPFNLSRHPNNDTAPRWSPDGKAIAWIGHRDTDEADIFYVWLRMEDEERTMRERTLTKAREKLEKAGSGLKPSKPGVAAEKAASKQPEPEFLGPPAPAAARTPRPGLRIDFDEIHERIRRISLPNSSESNLVWSPDSKKLGFTGVINGKRGFCTVEIPDHTKVNLLAAVVGDHPQWLKHED